MVSYAALSNTLLVSLLVAILSGTYSAIAEDAVAEDMFRKAVMTFEGVKSDSLFDCAWEAEYLRGWYIAHAASPRRRASLEPPRLERHVADLPLCLASLVPQDQYVF